MKLAAFIASGRFGLRSRKKCRQFFGAQIFSAIALSNLISTSETGRGLNDLPDCDGCQFEQYAFRTAVMTSFAGDGGRVIPSVMRRIASASGTFAQRQRFSAMQSSNRIKRRQMSGSLLWLNSRLAYRRFTPVEAAATTLFSGSMPAPPNFSKSSGVWTKTGLQTTGRRVAMSPLRARKLQ